MPWHRRTREPRAHWVLFTLGLVALLAALGLDGLAGHTGGGTVRPGLASNGNYAPPVDGPVVGADGKGTTARRMPARTVALTFDDGPDPVWTPRILDTLRRHGVKATFFVVGSRVNEHPELVRRIVAEGHGIGLHSFSHRDLAGLSGWQRRMELDLARTAVARAIGRDVRLFRPPYAGTPAGLDAAEWGVVADAGRDGYITVLADLDTRDWARPGADAIASAAAPTSDAGVIVLMHDGGGDRGQTVAALDTLLPALAARGRRAVTVADGLGGVAPDRSAGRTARIRGWALAVTQHLSGWVARVLFVLLVVATFLALIRMAIQGFSAWRHARRRRKPREGTFEPPLSVIVPAHNEAANIAATVESLVATGYPGLEVIVVDDGSTDGTAGIVTDLDLPGVRVVRQHNTGKAQALRNGIAQARHDLLILIDGDTIVEPETLHLLVQPFREGKVGAVAGNAKVANRGGLLGRWQHLEYVIAFNLDRRVFEVAGCMPTVPGALGAFRREALEAAGGVSADTLAEDTDVTMAVCRGGWRVVYEDSACAWTEAPGTWGGLWRQRYRWCYGTMQAMWKHRGALREQGAGGKLGRRGLSYLLLFQIMQPLLAPVVDVYLVYTLIFQPLSWTVVLWLGLHAAQLAVAAYAFRLDRESALPLWSLLLQQVVYRQLIYLVVIQSTVTALMGTRLRWHRQVRTGQAAALTAAAPGGPKPTAAQSAFIWQQLRRGRYRDPLWARICVWFGVLLVAVSGATLAAGIVLIGRYENAVQQADLLGEAATYHDAPDRHRAVDGPLNVLLIGVDWRQGQAGLFRADTIMVMHVPRTMDRAYLFSLPRDTLVDIDPSPQSGYPGGRDRINAAFAYGAGERQDRARGGRLLAQTAKRLTGLPGFDGAALIDFYGFMEVVKAMGGVDMCVDVKTKSIASGVMYDKGCRRMDATSALDYVRQRKSLADSDYGRQRHQQQFIKAIVKEATTTGMLTDPAKLDRVVRAAGGSLTVTTGPADMSEWLLALHGIPPEKITLLRTPGQGVHDATGRYLGETLDPVVQELFKAVREERLDQFLGAHPELVNRDAAQK